VRGQAGDEVIDLIAVQAGIRSIRAGRVVLAASMITDPVVHPTADSGVHLRHLKP